jgi:hypothetical protein
MRRQVAEALRAWVSDLQEMVEEEVEVNAEVTVVLPRPSVAQIEEVLVFDPRDDEVLITIGELAAYFVNSYFAELANRFPAAREALLAGGPVGSGELEVVLGDVLYPPP